MDIRSHKDLHVWKKSLDLVDLIYELTLLFPPNEKYGLASQMQRSAVSFPSNIAEGSARNSTKEFIQFLGIARGSLAELDTHLIIAHRRNYISYEAHQSAEVLLLEIARMLTGLIQSLKT